MTSSAIQGGLMLTVFLATGAITIYAGLTKRPRLFYWFAAIWLLMLLAGMYAIVVGRTIRAQRRAAQAQSRLLVIPRCDLFRSEGLTAHKTSRRVIGGCSPI